MIKTEPIKLNAEWNNIKHKLVYVISYVVFTILLWLISTYFSFTFYVIYIKNTSLWAICFVSVLLIDLLLFEFMVEMIIAILYSKRNQKKWCMDYLINLNLIRSLKALSP